MMGEQEEGGARPLLPLVLLLLLFFAPRALAVVRSACNEYQLFEFSLGYIIF